MPGVYHGDPTIYADLIPAQRVLRVFLLGIMASLPVELLSVRPQIGGLSSVAFASLP